MPILSFVVNVTSVVPSDGSASVEGAGLGVGGSTQAESLGRWGWALLSTPRKEYVLPNTAIRGSSFRFQCRGSMAVPENDLLDQLERSRHVVRLKILARSASVGHVWLDVRHSGGGHIAQWHVENIRLREVVGTYAEFFGFCDRNDRPVDTRRLGPDGIFGSLLH